METATNSRKPTSNRGFLVGFLQALHLAEFALRFRNFLFQFLLVDAIRSTVTGLRYFYFVVILRRLKTLDPKTGNVIARAVSHNQRNMTGVRGFAVTRSNLLVHPLSAIRISKSLPILSIGPRTEGEILNLMGLGFRNVRGLDLISYSPWIELGDMHALPYKDNEFSVVIMGWVLAYSSNRNKAALEAVRVVRDGGIIAVGAASDRSEERAKLPGLPSPQTLGELLGYFDPHVGHLYFAHDFPSFPTVKRCNLLALFSVKKSPNGPQTDPLSASTSV